MAQDQPLLQIDDLHVAYGQLRVLQGISLRIRAGGGIRRSLVGFLSPQDHVYDGLTASENLRLFTSLYGKGKNRAETEKHLEIVGLKNWTDQYVRSLSTGMKCRLIIAK